MSQVIIQHLSGSKANKIERFDTDGLSELTIGRDPNSRIAFDPQRDDSVSRKHAVIKITNPQRLAFVIVDLDSSNGTFVNGRKLAGERELLPEDVVELGSGGPKFSFDVQPRPPHLVAATRVIDLGTGAPTRTVDMGPGAPTRSVDAGAAAFATRDIPPLGSGKPGVGRETVERMLVDKQRETSRVWMYVLAGILLLVGLGGGALFLKHRQVEADLQAAQSTMRADISAAKAASAADVNQKMGVSARDIAQKFSNATVFIDVTWRVYDKVTSKPVFQRMQTTSRGQRLPCFVQIGDSYVPWLTTEDDDHTNEQIGAAGHGSGVVVSPSGYILTNKHVAAGWTSPYSLSAYQVGSGLFFQMQSDGSRVPSGTVFPLNNGRIVTWTPADGGRLFRSRFPVPVGNADGNLEGRNDVLLVRFPLNRLDIAARLVRFSTDADVASIKIDVEKQLAYVDPAAGTDDVPIGEPVTVLGYPGGSPIQTYAVVSSIENRKFNEHVENVPEPTISAGIVSKRGRGFSARASLADQASNVMAVGSMGDVFELSASGSPGLSGGPVFDSNGNLIALFTYYNPGQATDTYAYPIKYARALMELQRTN